MHRQSLSVVIPAYNESHRIVASLRKIDAYCRERFERVEIIVVNDGSTDATRDSVLRERDRIPSLKYREYEKNRGKGYAIREGVLSSNGELLLVTDADLSTPIEELERMCTYIDESFDLVIGSRALNRSTVLKRQPWWRETMGRSFNLIVRLLFSVDFKDTQCGFKLFKGTAARELFRSAIVDRFAYDVEILYLAGQSCLKIKELAVEWSNSPASTVNPVFDSLQMLKDLIKLKVKKRS